VRQVRGPRPKHYRTLRGGRTKHGGQQGAQGGRVRHRQGERPPRVPRGEEGRGCCRVPPGGQGPRQRDNNTKACTVTTDQPNKMDCFNWEVLSLQDVPKTLDNESRKTSRRKEQDRYYKLMEDCEILKKSNKFPIITNYCIEFTYWLKSTDRTIPGILIIEEKPGNERSVQDHKSLYINIENIINDLKKEIDKLELESTILIEQKFDKDKTKHNEKVGLSKPVSKEAIHAAKHLLAYWENLKCKLNNT
jgi:hypothetical protein